MTNTINTATLVALFGVSERTIYDIAKCDILVHAGHNFALIKIGQS